MGKGIIIGVIVVVLVLLVGSIVFLSVGEKESGNKKSNSIPPSTLSNNKPSITNEKAPSQGSAQTHTVKIQGFKFSPESLTIKEGDSVVWTNEDSAAHTATSTSAPESFDSDRLEKGDSFSFTFTEAGAYSYICNIHPSMKASITVQ